MRRKRRIFQHSNTQGYPLPDHIDLTKLHTLGKNGFYLLDKFFLNSACLTGSACGLMDPATATAVL